MAILSDADRREAWARWMRENQEEIGILKADLRAAVNAADQWVEDNQASYNSAIPQPARSAMTDKQKARLLFYVVDKRFGVF